MQTTKTHVAGTLFALWSAASLCGADSWLRPEREAFYSENGRFAVTIVPKQLEGDVHAFFYSVDPDGQLNLVREFKLVNEVMPATALVSGDGRYLATLTTGARLGTRMTPS